MGYNPFEKDMRTPEQRAADEADEAADAAIRAIRDAFHIDFWLTGNFQRFKKNIIEQLDTMTANDFYDAAKRHEAEAARRRPSPQNRSEP